MFDVSELPEPGTNKGRGAQTARGHRRQALILKKASEMFAAFGYDSVSINDIGAAAGISGPGIYRYFDGKEAILAAVFDHLHTRHREGFRDVMAEGGTDDDVLHGLVSLQIELAVSEPEKIRIIGAEERHLPEEMAVALRDERRKTLRVMSDLLRRGRPALSAEEADVTIHAVLALINSVSLRRDAEPLTDRAIKHLERMALAVLHVS